MPLKIERIVTSIGGSKGITLPKGAMIGKKVVVFLNRVGVIIPKELIEEKSAENVVGEIHELAEDIWKELSKDVSGQEETSDKTQ